MRTFEQAQKLDVAIKIALERIKPISAAEEIATMEAYGRILAQEIVCSIDLPGFARSAMDGYAVRAAQIKGASRARPVEFSIIGLAKMGQDPRSLPILQDGEALEITTGGPMPPGADSVVMLEEAERPNPNCVRIFSAVESGTHVLAANSDFKCGERIFHWGHRLRAVDIGALLAMGILSLEVFQRLRVGVLSSGDELVAATTHPKPGQVREINSHVLRGLIEGQDAQAHSYKIVPDDREELRAAVERAVRENDLVLISGGSSVGARDWTLVILRELGEVLFHGLQIKPGKPTICAFIRRTPVVGLPGNPVSCAVVFEKFVRPLIAKRSGLKVLLPSHRLTPARLLQTVHSVIDREDFVAVRLRLDEANGALYAEPIYGHSNNISTLARADGIISVPAETEELREGTQVWVELL